MQGGYYFEFKRRGVSRLVLLTLLILLYQATSTAQAQGFEDPFQSPERLACINETYTYMAPDARCIVSQRWVKVCEQVPVYDPIFGEVYTEVCEWELKTYNTCTSNPVAAGGRCDLAWVWDIEVGLTGPTYTTRPNDQGYIARPNDCISDPIFIGTCRQISASMCIGSLPSGGSPDSFVPSYRICPVGGGTEVVPPACSNFSEPTVCGYSEYRTVYQGPPYNNRPEVTELQKSLNLLGHNTGVVDGLYGSNTARGVRSYVGGTGSSFSSWQQLESDIAGTCSFTCTDVIEKTVSVQTNPSFTPGISINTSEGGGTTSFTVETTDTYPDGDKFFVDIDDAYKTITRDGIEWEFDVWQIDDSQRTPGDDRVNFILDEDPNRRNRVAIAHYRQATSDLDVTLTADPITIDPGATSTLTWTTEGDPIFCTASNGWSGSKNVNGGTQQVSPDETTSYTLTCTDGVNSDFDTAIVVVDAEDPVDVNVGGTRKANGCYDADWEVNVSGVECNPSASPPLGSWTTTVTAQLAAGQTSGEVELCDVETATTITLTCGPYSDSASIVAPFLREINPGQTPFNLFNFLRDLFPGFVKSSYATN